MTRETPPERTAYPHHTRITTRWMDNDIYGHVNNVVYYSYFDTAVNEHLINQGALDIHTGDTVGLVVESSCRYHAPLTFPEPITAGLRVTRIGTSSVRYEIGLFRADEPTAAADGHFVHVYVNRDTRRPAPLPARLREVLEALVP